MNDGMYVPDRIRNNGDNICSEREANTTEQTTITNTSTITEITLESLYDNGGETLDRYTALFSAETRDVGDHDGSSSRYEYWALSLSANPFHPLGVCIHGDGDIGGVLERDTQIELSEAPGDVQKAIQQEMAHAEADK